MFIIGNKPLKKGLSKNSLLKKTKNYTTMAAKFKVMELNWYVKLNSDHFGSWKQELLDKNKQKSHGYDGPASYLKIAKDEFLIQFPKKEGVWFCIRIGKQKYKRYCYQENKWFEEIEPHFGGYNFPGINPKAETLRILNKIPHKLLRPQYQTLQDNLRVMEQSRQIGRDTEKWLLKIK